MIGKKFRAIRDVPYEEIFAPIEPGDEEKVGTVAIPIGATGICDQDWGDGFVGMKLDDSVRNPYDPTVAADWLAVPANAFEEVKE